MNLRTATWDELDARTAYELLRLRADVFVVEQDSVYPDLDGRDLEPAARHLWTWDAAGPTSYLRLLDDGDAARIGRVVTRPDARGAGLAAALVDAALALVPGRAVVLGAQVQLTGWYGRWGFEVSGEEYDDGGVPHVPMRRPGRTRAGS